MSERKRQKLELKIRDIVGEEDISNILFLIDGASDFIYFLLEFELDDVDFSNVTFIATEKSFDLVYKFLLEKYPEKAYLFANVMARDNKLKLISNDEQIRITKLLFQRLFYYLEDEYNDLNESLNLLRKELKDETTSREYFDVSLEEIDNFVKLVNIRYNYLSKNSIKQLAFKKLLSVEYDYYSNYSPETGMVNLELSYDVLFTIGLLHEYMHKDNSIFVLDEDNDEFIYGEAYDYLSELSSITMELEFLDWLYKNGYISELDYKYAIDYRFSDILVAADYLAYVKEIFDIYDGYDNDNEKKLDELEDRFIEEGYNMNFQTIVDRFNYLMSFVLAITIMKRNKQLLNYQEVFIKVNDTICQSGYYDVLNMLGLNYCNEIVLNELLDNLSYYYKSYNNLLNRARKRIK